MLTCTGTTIETRTSLRSGADGGDQFEADCHTFAAAMCLTFMRSVEVYHKKASQRTDPSVPNRWMNWAELAQAYLATCLNSELDPSQSILDEYFNNLLQGNASIRPEDAKVVLFVLRAALDATRPSAEFIAGSDLDDWHVDP